MEIQAFEEIIKYAIAREQEAVDFYNKLQSQTAFESLKKELLDFQKMEENHIKILNNLDIQKIESRSINDIQDLHISDLTVDTTDGEPTTYQELLIVAMKREEKAQLLYSNLAKQLSNTGLKQTFEVLAQEEAKHKLFFESKYDDEILTDN